MIVRRRTNLRHLTSAVAALALLLAVAGGCGRSEEDDGDEVTDPGAEYERTHFTASPEASPFYGLAPFTSTFSVEPKNAKGSVKYLWDFNDGSPRVTDKTPTHTFTKPGLYTVGLQATDDSGEVDGGAVIVRAMTPEEWEAVQAKGKAAGDADK